MSVSQSRKEIANAKRFVIKVGSSVITDSNGFINVSQLGSIVEQISNLLARGRQVVLVSSGSIVVGKQRLLGSSVHGDPRVFAAAGQSGLMSLYEQLFATKHIVCSQILVTYDDLNNSMRKSTLKTTIESLIDLGSLCILNENDVVSHRVIEPNGKPLDNDSLAATLAPLIGAECLVILSDVEGLYREPPQDGKVPRIVPVYPVENPPSNITIGSPNSVGRGGMRSKFESCITAVKGGVRAVVICSGFSQKNIERIAMGENVGTLFVARLEGTQSAEEEPSFVAARARQASRELLRLSGEQRSAVLTELARSLVRNKKKIMSANRVDLNNARANQLAPPLLKRLSLTADKIDTVARGIHQLAASVDPVDQVVERKELVQGLVLEKRRVPLGLVMVIFESRPEVLPQVAALALRSGNGLLLKGGKEAKQSNKMLIRIIADAIEVGSGRRVSGWCVSLVSTREDVRALLALRDQIDLVIPRGSGALVKSIEANTRIPVLGHSEGVCHVFVHRSALFEVAKRVIVESKLDYPAACNALETLLLDAHFERISELLAQLQQAGIQCFGGPRVRLLHPEMPAAASFSEEYGDNRLTVEIVSDVAEAVAHINEHGSKHTDCIVSADDEATAYFVKNADSSSAFHNVSTRFADGFRFGLGAEVGINTGKVSARGPVGVEGLLTNKWILESADKKHGHIIGDIKAYTHKNIPLAKL